MGTPVSHLYPFPSGQCHCINTLSLSPSFFCVVSYSGEDVSDHTVHVWQLWQHVSGKPRRQVTRHPPPRQCQSHHCQSRTALLVKLLIISSSFLLPLRHSQMLRWSILLQHLHCVRDVSVKAGTQFFRFTFSCSVWISHPFNWIRKVILCIVRNMND